MTAPATYEERDCYRCHRGRIYRPPTLHGARGTYVDCPECNGTSKVLVYLYAMDHARRRGRSA